MRNEEECVGGWVGKGDAYSEVPRVRIEIEEGGKEMTVTKQLRTKFHTTKTMC